MPSSTHTKTYKQLLGQLASYAFRGHLSIRDGHLPQAKHAVPNDFIGVCVATNHDPETDHYIFAQLETLNIQQVRLDFSYQDIGSFNERFLTALTEKGYQVTLRLFPPFESAKNMLEASEQETWQRFLNTVLNRYSKVIAQIEIGNTINRKRWAGYTLDSFLKTWEIGHQVVRSRGIKLLGPNIQDFEPMYNIGILKLLQERDQLPDIHTDNLFVERVSEPERYDHRILKFQWSKIFKYNLVKKARILQSIGQDFGVTQTSSAAAFWAIYRIKRLLVHGKQKQADYLTRYFTLLAASGALQQANWGSLICHREGLITDGLTDEEYPPLERISYYQSADGMLSEYTRYPSFYAMQTILTHLPGAYYHQAIATTHGLEIHHFSNESKQFDIAWTINGKVAYLADIYSESTLKSAVKLHRDGEKLTKNTELVCETPIYLCWEKNFTITRQSNPKLAKHLSLYAHIIDKQYFQFNQDGWTGLILANNQTEADTLAKTLHPDSLQSPTKQGSLRHARNVIWAQTDPRNPNKQLTIKQPFKMYPHKRFFDRFKPSKAKRSWNGSIELLRRGIGTAAPIAFFEKINDDTLKQNFYLCEHVNADFSIGEIFAAFAQGEDSYKDISQKTMFKHFAKFSHEMHTSGIYFRDYSGGNILVSKQVDHTLDFALIDTARIHTFNRPTPFKLRIADLTRACHRLPMPLREQFLYQYLAHSGRKLTFDIKAKFWLYDFKVKLKRTIGRKGMKKLMKRFKQS